MWAGIEPGNESKTIYFPWVVLYVQIETKLERIRIAVWGRIEPRNDNIYS